MKELWKDKTFREKMLESHRTRVVKHGFAKKGEKSRFYKTYENMKARCNDKTRRNYKNYGGKGIIVEWKSFIEFKNDMYPSYLQHLKRHGIKQTSIDRIDNARNYSKENCRWATRKTQSKNQMHRNNYPPILERGICNHGHIIKTVDDLYICTINTGAIRKWCKQCSKSRYAHKVYPK